MFAAQRDKLTRRFALLDVDDDGYITRQDLDQLAERLQDSLVPDDATDDRAVIRDGYREVWNRLIAHADRDGDDRISMEEYIVAVGSGILNNPQCYEKVVSRPVEVIFRSLDADHDGVVSHEELQDAVRDFYYGDTLDSPGALVFGKAR